MSTSCVLRLIKEQGIKLEFLQRIVGSFLAAMYNGAPPMYGYYGYRYPPPNAASYTSPRGFQFSPRGYPAFSQGKKFVFMTERYNGTSL